MATDPANSTESVEHIEVGLVPSQGPSEFAYVLAKLSYEIKNGACHPAEPEPLIGDFRAKDIEPRLQPGTDYCAFKELTDFVVRGSAYAPGHPVSQMEISLEVGQIVKRVAVFGRRPVEWEASGRPRFPTAEPFSEIEMIDANTYGGIDWRAPLDEADPNIARYALECDFPGLYPRNQYGKGYLCDPKPIDDIELPNFEDPDDLLTPRRLIVPDPRQWWRQPLPWTLDWMSGAAFPRVVFFMAECDAWYPGPDDESLPEVRRGFAAPGFCKAMQDQVIPDPLFFQEASHGLALRDLRGGTPVCIRGMHPTEQDVRFELPNPPTIEFEVDGHRSFMEPRLTSVICRPAEKKFTMTYAVVVNELPRVFLPGIHKHIPISARINGGPPVHYQAPPTVKELIKKGEERVAQEEAEKKVKADPKPDRA